MNAAQMLGHAIISQLEDCRLCCHGHSRNLGMQGKWECV